jgi:hypothetical protein
MNEDKMSRTCNKHERSEKLKKMFRKFQGKRTPDRSRCRWNDRVTRTLEKKGGLNSPVQDSGQFRTSLKTAVNTVVLQNDRAFWTSYFVRNILYHGVRQIKKARLGTHNRMHLVCRQQKLSQIFVND